MKNVVIKCDQCPKEFSKPSQKQAEAALRMHRGRIHSKHISTARGPRPRTVPQHTGVVVPDGANGIDRRTKAWRAANPRRALGHPRRIQCEMRVNFCPNCGCDIHKVAVGMATAMVAPKS